LKDENVASESSESVSLSDPLCCFFFFYTRSEVSQSVSLRSAVGVTRGTWETISTATVVMPTFFFFERETPVEKLVPYI